MVNLSGTGSEFFDKVATIDGANDINSQFQLTWNIVNNTPYTWSDYHMVLTDSGETIVTGTTNSAEFKDVSFNSLTVDWAIGTGGKLIAPGDTLHLDLGLNTSNFTLADLPATFDIRQIATASAVPLPPSALLLGTGLLGLVGLGWRRRKTS